MTLLSSKYRNASAAAQIQHLVRIGRRAAARADWLRELASRNEENLASPGFYETDDERALAAVEIRNWRAGAATAEAKAAAAVDEILAIANASDDLDLRRKARAARLR